MTDPTSENAASACPRCGGIGYFRADVLPGRAGFGGLVPCTCTLQKKAQAKAEAERAKRARRAARRRERWAAMSPPAKDLTSFSYSMLATLRQCPHRFLLRYVKGQNTDTGADRDHIIGSILHSTLHAFMREASQARTEPRLEALFNDTWPKFWGSLRSAREEEQRLRLETWYSLSQFFRTGYLQGRPRALEKRFTFTLGECTVKGTIDRIDDIGQDGYELVDYKSSAQPLTEKQARRDMQTVLYYFGAKALYAEQPPARISYLFVNQGTRVTVAPTERQMEKGLARAATLIDKVRSRKTFRARRNEFCRNCKWNGKCSATKLK